MAYGITDKQNFIDIASAIRNRAGTTTKYKPNQMANAILAIPVGGGSGGESTGGGIVEIKTAVEMDAVQTAENVGNVYLYKGETTDDYRSGCIYILLQEGGNIAFLDKSKANPNLGGFPCQIYNYPLSHNFTNGDTVNINFKLDGGTLQTVSSPYIETPITETFNGQMIGDPEMDGMNMLVQNEEIMIYMMCYLNINPFVQIEDGNMGIGQVYAIMWQPLTEDEKWETYVPEVEIVSFSKDGQEVINPISQYLSGPYLTLAPITDDVATSKDIRNGYAAYNDNGQLIEGEMNNPEELSSQEEIDAILSEHRFSGRVYQLYNSIGEYSAGLYKVAGYSNELRLEPLQVLQPLTNPATYKDIRYGKYAYDDQGNQLGGQAPSPFRIETAEEMQSYFADKINNSSDSDIYRYSGTTTNNFRYDNLYRVALADMEQVDGDTIYHFCAEPVFTMSEVAATSYHTKIKYAGVINRNYAFANWSEIEVFDCCRPDRMNPIPQYAFYNCTSLKAFVIRFTNYVATLRNINAFEKTPIAGDVMSVGRGYIYVPDALVEHYKVAENWSTYAEQIKPLSEYVEE